MGAILGDGHAAGVQAADAVSHFVHLHMGMAEQENGALRQGRQIIRIRVVAVGQVEGFAIQ